LTVLKNVTLASSNSALPEDGNYNETCWGYLNANFNTPLKKLCISWCKTLVIQDAQYDCEKKGFTLFLPNIDIPSRSVTTLNPKLQPVIYSFNKSVLKILVLD
jgi:hypothetical protein